MISLLALYHQVLLDWPTDEVMLLMGTAVVVSVIFTVEFNAVVTGGVFVVVAVIGAFVLLLSKTTDLTLSAVVVEVDVDVVVIEVDVVVGGRTVVDAPFCSSLETSI